MKTWKLMSAALALTAGSAAALAQSPEIEQREAEVRQRAAEMEAVEAEHTQALREAEARLAEAAARVAELSTRNLPEIVQLQERVVKMHGRPRIGITIATDEDGPVDGVRIIGVTPGSAAAEAGLRSGDVLTGVNNESLGAESQIEANKRLLGFVKTLEEGDKLDIEYLRGGNVGKVTVEPRPLDDKVFVFRGPEGMDIERDLDIDHEALANSVNAFAFRFGGRGWADMELVELNEGLGKYFGTDEGLLVVSAPKSDALKLEDGDVIQSIDGREPESVSHAIRILSSYQPGESLELAIMRDKRRRTLDVEIPDDRTSFLAPAPPPPARFAPPHRRVAPVPGVVPPAPLPALAPVPPVAGETST